jgi:hypothetical protein
LLIATFPCKYNNRSGYKLLTFFQAAGIAASLLCALFINASVVWAPSNRPMSASLVEEILDSFPVEAIFVAPSILEELSQSSESLERLSKLDGVNFGGGKFRPGALV